MITMILKRVLGQGNLGRIDCFRQGVQNGWGGPFNGQRFRQLIFFDLLYHFPIRAIVETGTFRGTTTALFGATGLPVYTAEIHPRYCAYSRMRFLFNRAGIHLYQRDSVSFLRGLSDDDSVPRESVFFYLDAHWGTDLPLRDELEIIFSQWARPIVMIDDFQVPGSGYGFDDYGQGKAIDLAYIDPVVSAFRLSIFFPSVNSSEETGSKRGSCVLCEEKTGSEVEARIRTLVRSASRACGPAFPEVSSG